MSDPNATNIIISGTDATAPAFRSVRTGLEGVGAAATGANQQLTQAGAAFIQSLERQAATVGKSRVELANFKAAQLGVAEAAAPLIARLQSADSTVAKLGISAGQTTAAFRTLPAQFTDIATQLAGGQSPFLILLQQGGQIKDSFGGIGPALKAVTSLITPTTVAVAGLAAGFAGLGIAIGHAESMQRSLNSLEAQLTATGRAGMFSTEQLKALIQQLALAPGVTRDAATQVVSDLTKIHGIGADLFRDLAAAAVDYAKATGTDLPTAAKTLAQAFADPARGAKTLDDALGTLTSTQLLQIESMSKANDMAGAQRVLFEALEASVKGLAINALTPLQTSINELGNAWEKTMQSFDKSDGMKNATIVMGGLLGKLTQFISYLPEFERKWKGAFSGGLNGVAMGLLGLNNAAEAGPQTGGATGSWDEPAPVKARVASAADNEIKRALDAAKAYKGQAAVIADLTAERKSFNSALTKSIDLYGKESEQAQKFRDAIAGVDEKIKAAQKRLTGPAPKAFQDDAATKMLETLRQTEASLKEQLSSETKLTAAEKERAKFTQLITDLRTKGTLTAEQKSLLAGQDKIKAQLDVNVAVSQEVELKKKIDEITKKEVENAKDLARTFQGINIAMESANQSRREQYDRTLSTVGLGGRARHESDAQRSIEIESQRNLRQATKAASEKPGGLDSAAHKEEVAKIKDSLEEARGDLADFYTRDKANRENWVNGAREAFANYADEASNAAKHTEEVFGNALKGIEDQLTNLFTGKKFDGKKLLEDIQGDLARNFVKENITGPLATMGGDLLGDGGALSGLLGGSKNANGARGNSAANPLFVRSADGVFGSSSASGKGAGDWASSAIGKLFGGMSNGFATTAANALPGDSLDNLINLQGGWGTMMPAFATGTDFVPRDMIAKIHKGERITRAADNVSAAGRGGSSGRQTIVNLTMNVPSGTDTKTAGQWGAAASRQMRMHETRNA